MIECPPSYYGQVLTIIVTNDCNLRCKYCYEYNKCNRGTISLETVDRFITMLIDGKFDVGMESFEIDLLGGDALMYPELCGRIIDATMKRMVLSGFKYRDNIKFSICSNGTLFRNPKVREFLIKYKPFLSMGVSIDGCPTLHDMNRVFPSGKGSMDSILKWWPWYQAEFPEDSKYTKATLSKASIPYIYESLVYMHEVLGLRYIHQNFIMENANLTAKDIADFDHQMVLCTEYMYQHKDDLYWSMLGKQYLARKNGTPIPNVGRCGSGLMPTVDVDGQIYACPRWCPFAIGDKAISLGDVYSATFDKSKANFIAENCKRNIITKDPKCKTCDFEEQCAYCPAGCYGEFGEFKRTTYICPITRIQSKWAERYWRMIDEKDQG